MTTRSRLTVALASMMLLVAAAGGAMAAYDTETTDTTTTSDISGTTNTVTLIPGDSSEALYVETDGVSADAADLELRITVADPGVNHTAYRNASPVTNDGTNGHYAWNITHDELSDLPRDESSATYNVTVYNTSSETELESTEVTFDSSGQGTTDAVIAVTTDSRNSSAAASGTHEVADRLEMDTKTAWFGYGTETNVSTWSGYTTINGTSSDVTVHLEESNAVDSYDAAASDYEEGDWIKEATLFANGVPMKVFKGSAPDDVDNETHAVYYADTDTLEVHLAGSEYEDVSTLQLRGGSGETYAFGEAWSNFGAQAAFSSWLGI
jgi:hypothetical protein